jgi:hypothetical protein
LGEASLHARREDGKDAFWKIRTLFERSTAGGCVEINELTLALQLRARMTGYYGLYYL